MINQAGNCFESSQEALLNLSSQIKMSREQRLNNIINEKSWDMIIIGGGITGAGILKMASQWGLKVLLVEQKDFAWGSSSRSSKMVHGGLRYMAQGQFNLTRESVLERQRLLNEAPSLITKQSFVMSHYKRLFPGPKIFNCLLAMYDYIAGVKQHKFWQKMPYLNLVPKIKETNLLGGTQFFDAMTEDARLVQRLIQESLQLGGQALNYAKVSKLEYAKDNTTISGVALVVEAHELPISLKANVVVNASGAWANQFNQATSKGEAHRLATKMRPLRGSHLIFPSWVLPVASAISIRHPNDHRPVQIYPWQNVTVVGTTDVEHHESLHNEACISRTEIDYLMQAIQAQFSDLNIQESDITSTFSGIRPVITTDGSKDPSKEKREHSIESSNGYIAVTGGKLTTFRLIAEQVMTLVNDQLKLPMNNKSLQHKFTQPILSAINLSAMKFNSMAIKSQVLACYGEFSAHFIAMMNSDLHHAIRYSRHLWSELIWSVKFEQVHHLDDLLLRRTRLGNVLPNGAIDLLPEIQRICSAYLSWDAQKWQAEISRYQSIWKTYYSLPTVQRPSKKEVER